MGAMSKNSPSAASVNMAATNARSLAAARTREAPSISPYGLMAFPEIFMPVRRGERGFLNEMVRLTRCNTASIAD
jgi:hypothetical protein